MGYWIKGTVTGEATATLELNVSYSHLVAADEAFNGADADDVDPYDAMNYLDDEGLLAAQFGGAYEEIMEELRDNCYGCVDVSERGSGMVEVEVSVCVEIERTFDFETRFHEKITCWEYAFQREFDVRIGVKECRKELNDLDLGSGVSCDKCSCFIDSAEFDCEGEDGQTYSLGF